MDLVGQGNGLCHGVPGSADVPVGTANEDVNDTAVSDEALAVHSQANEDVGVPRRGTSRQIHPQTKRGPFKERRNLSAVAMGSP